MRVRACHNLRRDETKMQLLSSIPKRIAAEPERSLCVLIAAIATIWVVVYPFSLVTHPPLTDLPFHAANVSIIRHYWDPAWHFREQFVIDWLGVPYLTSYALGSTLCLLLPIEWAMKLTAIAMLLLLPAGLAVLFAGMRKSPIWGLLGLSLVWSDLTHWGFLNAVGALGLYAMSIGLALFVFDRPTRRLRIALGTVLVLVLVTHPFRFPFAIAAVLLAALLTSPRRRALREIAIASAPALALAAIWIARRPSALRPERASFEFHADRFVRIRDHLFNGYVHDAGALEKSRAWQMLAVFGVLIVIGVTARLVRIPLDNGTVRRWPIATALPLVLAAGHLVLFFALPVRLGEWWYVYPRELVAAAYLGLAALPELPQKPLLRLCAVAAIAVVTVRMASVVAEQWRSFERENADFREIAALVPRAPRLFYLVYEHRGGSKTHSPYVHMPAWIQATHGGWLGFHFAGWGLFPIRYRVGGPGVPPILPREWEWEPQRFVVLEHGRGFDTFLVRHTIDPAPLFAADPAVRFIARRGRWWLYERRP